jgi:flagellar basal-body rod protein FlgG
MRDFVDSATAMMATANERVALSAQNVANISTPGYRRRESFQSILDRADANPTMATSLDLSSGQLIDTHNTYDLALSGDGYFTIRAGDQIIYTRRGQFFRDGEGRLITGEGYALQTQAGGDLTLTGGAVTIQPDGLVLEDGQPTARIALASLTDPSPFAGSGALFSAREAAPAANVTIRQGALEASNVSLGDEMVAIMASLRQAEAGQRLVTLYDDLMGRVLTAFSQGGGS